jgi:hypothetical protein
MENKPTLLVLAAGMGSRYGGLKQLDQFGPSGETIVEYSIYDALRAGFGKVIFVIRRSFEAEFRALFQEKLAGHIALDFVAQELDLLPAGFSVPANRVKPWGTGHALWVTAGKINGPFAVINSDDFYGRQSFRLMADFLRTPSPPAAATYALVGYKLANTLSPHGSVARGICEVDPDGFLQSVTELTRISRQDGQIRYAEPDGASGQLRGDETVSMNMMGFSPSVYGVCEKYLKEFLTQRGHDPKAEYYLPKMINRLIQEGLARVKILPTPAAWFGVTYPEDKAGVVAQLEALVKAGEYPENLWAETQNSQGQTSQRL